MVTFQAPTVLPGTADDDAEAPHIASSGSNVYIVWHEPPVKTPVGAAKRLHDVFFARSTNKGKAFPSITNLSATPNDSSESEVVVARDSRVYAAWIETNSNTNDTTVLFRRSGDNGKTFEATKALSGAGSQGIVELDLAASSHDVYVVWLDGQDVFAVRSDNNGKTFSAPVNVSKSQTALGSKVTVSDDRGVVAWRDNDANGNGKVFFAQGH